jgi:hypothetical protein
VRGSAEACYPVLDALEQPDPRDGGERKHDSRLITGVTREHRQARFGNFYALTSPSTCATLAPRKCRVLARLSRHRAPSIMRLDALSPEPKALEYYGLLQCVAHIIHWTHCVFELLSQGMAVNRVCSYLGLNQHSKLVERFRPLPLPTAFRLVGARCLGTAPWPYL